LMTKLLSRIERRELNIQHMYGTHAELLLTVQACQAPHSISHLIP
jgi:hypothetical protein